MEEDLRPEIVDQDEQDENPAQPCPEGPADTEEEPLDPTFHRRLMAAKAKYGQDASPRIDFPRSTNTH
jgi:hypothetical protein